MSAKKKILTTCVVLAVCAAGGVFAWKYFGQGPAGGSSEPKAYVTKVSQLTGD